MKAIQISQNTEKQLPELKSSKSNPKSSFLINQLKQDIKSLSNSSDFHKVFSNPKLIKKDILSNYNSFITSIETKPLFLSNIIKKTNRKINKLKFNSIYKTITPIQTLNTLSTTDNTQLINDETNKLIKNYSDIKMIPNMSKENIAIEFEKSKNKTIDLERRNICK